MTDEIRIEKSEGPLGWIHYNFYIRGERRGSAPTRQQAESAARELLAKIVQNENKTVNEQLTEEEPDDTVCKLD